MGCVASNPEGKANRQIGRKQQQLEKNEKREKKLLLLGTGGSGKSTVFKNLRKVHGEDICDERTMLETRNTIRSNLLTGMFTLLSKSEYLYSLDSEKNADCKVDLENQADLIDHIRLVVSMGKDQDGTFSDDDTSSIGPEQLVQLGQSIAILWGLPAIQQTYAKRGGVFSFPDNMDSFYSKVEEIMRDDYVCSDQDIIEARVRTTGIIKYTYEKDDTRFHITDVGGQRNERKKWIHQFDNITAVIFLCALNHYNAVLFEDEQRNAMHECIQLWKEIVDSKWFRHSHLILFLNKRDLFIRALQSGASLATCFSKEAQWDGEEWKGPDYHPIPDDEEADEIEFSRCYNEALFFIQRVLFSINKNPVRVIYAHVTEATQSDNVKKVFWDVQNIVIRENLMRGGLMGQMSSAYQSQESGIMTNQSFAAQTQAEMDEVKTE